MFYLNIVDVFYGYTFEFRLDIFAYFFWHYIFWKISCELLTSRTSTKCLQIRNVTEKKILARSKEASNVNCNVALLQCYYCVMQGICVLTQALSDDVMDV